ncbi:MAG: ATPase [Verrucomicrobiales bacterium]|nr:ATPase [Verrucomicrobiales bacterium]|tara:strand:- start:1292 stop:2455 length:1164 start_codon:yes stop_codon:yes gene_type:complete
MIERPHWQDRLQQAWRKAPVAWLAGVRRVGKTVLAQSIGDAEFLNCDLPSSEERLRDPEEFFRSVKKEVVVLDEVHQLPDPSRLLKIAADAFPKLKVLATGSSTLQATKKFRDSLTGRKREVVLTPVLAEELPAFGITDLRDRLLRGGLPPALLAETLEPEFYGEWFDSYFARDVQELFGVGKRANFLNLLELVLRQSGGLMEVTSMAKHCGATRPTVMNWLDVFQITQVARLLRPYSEGGRRELVAQPKVYGFDTGFVCYARGWNEVRPEDCGQLWEHLVLDTLLSLPISKIHFWRDKQQREVDFVVPRGRGVVDAIECKWSTHSFETRGLKAFRDNYPKGRNYLVSPQASKSFVRKLDGLSVKFIASESLRKEFSRSNPKAITQL